ncbi:MAG: response regulator [Betaproteobacteria bacterium]|nr:response regulator [Betaproteobacteria bacterium]
MNMAAPNKVNLLLVDDQPARLLSYDAILAGLGHNLVHARSGEEALQRLMELDFAAILLDINMPGMDGFETAALIHQHPRFEKTPIIFVTAVHVTDLDRLKGYTLGAVDYVYVPVIPEILRGKVQVLVELYRHRRELELVNQKLARSNTELAQANIALQAEKTRELEALNASLAAANQELERTNRSLQTEIAQRIRAQAALEDADRRKDDFLAMLSHELRNPLAAIQGAIELMQRKQIEDPQLAWARAVLARQNQHLSRLIEDLLDVSRITRGVLALKKLPVDLREMLEHALEAIRPMIAAQQHALAVKIPGAPVPVLGDPVRLTQVVSNLLSNAAKYTEPEGRISLTLAITGADDNAQAVIEVEDNGRGIDAAALPRLFEPSTHAERLSRGAHGGLGIGLVVVRGLAEMHGGRVEAFSEGSGRGSRFTVRLPVLQAAAAAGAAPEPAPAPVPAACANGALRILVVDDNEDSAESMSMLLQCDGHDTDTAYSGETALRLACSLRPDVVLLDIGMPGMLGYEVARRLRSLEEAAHAMLIAVTGYGRESDVAKARDAGFDHHLVKPVDFDKLRSLLATRQGSLQSG